MPADLRRRLAQEARMMRFHTVVNSVAGSAFVPRPLRAAIYRVMGVQAKTSNVFSGCRITGPRLRLGEQTFVNHGCYFDVARGEIDIGRRCLLAPEVMVLAVTHELLPDGQVDRATRALRTVVEDDVWLGARVVVMPGVRIGAGCVVAAGAVV
ncbi:MAG: acyltransferase, partial [Angustibacter sp.]